MTDGAVAGACRLDECPVASEGDECVLGHPILHCENFEPEPDGTVVAAIDDGELTADSDPGEPSQSWLAADAEANGSNSIGTAGQPLDAASGRVPRPDGPRRLVELSDDNAAFVMLGSPLSASEATFTLGSEPTVTVVLAGPPSSGKTTMLAVLYEMFCRDPVGEWFFAGSRTLLGFMQRSWYASAASGAEGPMTPRTHYNVQRPYLHLRTCRIDHAPHGIMFADLSGEYFRNVGSGGNLGEAAPIVARADHVVHIVDAGWFANERDRQQARRNIASTFRRLAESESFSSKALHVVAIARHDLCPKEYSDTLKAIVTQLATQWLPPSPIVEVAARPADDTEPRGIDLLLNALARRPDNASVQPAIVLPLRPIVVSLARAAAANTSVPSGRTSNSSRFQ